MTVMRIRIRIRIKTRIQIIITVKRRIRIFIKVKLQELRRLKMEPRRAVDADNGGMEAQNRAVEVR
jgi:hypothetical protein